MTRIFKSGLICELLSSEEQDALVKDFLSYKRTGSVPTNFGRDVPYDHPHTLPIVIAEDIRHIHLCSEDEPFSLKKIQFHRTSDVHLVYCQGATDQNAYLLMSILSPNGHEKAKSREIMYRLGKMAEMFRNQY